MKLRSWQLRLYFAVGFLSLGLIYNNCGKSQFQISGSSGQSSSQGTVPGTGGGGSGSLNILGNEGNVVSLSVGCGYINQLCVNVTICAPGGGACETVNNLLLDTGSAGLRVFSSALSASLLSALPQSVDASGKSIAECISYADGTSQWGPVKTADIQLGQEKANQVPIQIIDSSFATAPSDCTNLDSAFPGYNGILGVSFFKEDCGAGCTTLANNRIYFTCSGTSCTSSTVALNLQVANPISRLAVNNNGIAIQLPSVGSSGANTVTGYMVLGIGTQNNNTFTKASVFKPDALGYIKTLYNGSTLAAFIDSGSNGLFFPAPASLPGCGTSLSGFYCPSSIQYFNATQVSADNSKQQSIAFSVESASVLINTGHRAFSNLGGELNGDFDWGLPFFLGRTVFVGIENKTSNLGTGPLWAY